MSKIFRAMILLVALGSCGSKNFSAPRNLDNACSIVSERPAYLRAFKATERKWGVPVPVLMAIIYQESKFIGNNRTPHQYALGVIPVGRQSSAFGYSQALDATWREYQQREGGRGARRDNIRDASDFMGWYMNQTKDEIGISMSNTRDQYLAYHEGRTGFVRGTWKRKSWLARIAGEVDARAFMYDTQLRGCRKI